MSNLVTINLAGSPKAERREQTAKQAPASKVEQDFPAAEEGVR
jgi:hypothetical protein